jgi:hypothetical protein
LRTERGELCAYVYVDLASGIDLQGYVERAKHTVDAAMASHEVQVQPDERIEWTGQYNLLVSGQKRLKWIIPLVALSMLGLLFLQFRSLTEALLVLAAVPFALVGSVWTLFLLGYPLSAPVWVGLLSVVGLAMQTGVVMVVYIDEAFHRSVRKGTLRTREDIVAAHAEGTVRRLRPKIMTITTMAADAATTCDVRPDRSSRSSAAEASSTSPNPATAPNRVYTLHQDVTPPITDAGSGTLKCSPKADSQAGSAAHHPSGTRSTAKRSGSVGASLRRRTMTTATIARARVA